MGSIRPPQTSQSLQLQQQRQGSQPGLKSSGLQKIQASAVVMTDLEGWLYKLYGVDQALEWVTLVQGISQGHSLNIHRVLMLGLVGQEVSVEIGKGQDISLSNSRSSSGFILYSGHKAGSVLLAAAGIGER